MPSRVGAASGGLDYRRIAYLLLALAAAWLVLAATAVVVQAGETRTLIVPAEDGYGIAADCLSGTKACGHVVADAWCKAQGLSGALSYGRAEDVTGSLPTAKPVDVDPSAFIVTCGG